MSIFAPLASLHETRSFIFQKVLIEKCIEDDEAQFQLLLRKHFVGHTIENFMGILRKNNDLDPRILSLLRLS